MNSISPKFKITKKAAVVLLLIVLLCLAGHALHRHRQWKQLYDTGVRYSEQGEYRKTVAHLFAAVEHSPRKNKAYDKLEDVFNCYGEYNNIHALQHVAQTSAEILKLTSGWYASENYIPFNDSAAADAMTVQSETAVNADGGYSVYDYDAEGNLIRRSFYTVSGEIEKYTLNAFDKKGNQILTAEYDACGIFQNGWINLYSDNGIRYSTVDFYPSGAIENITDYDTDGTKLCSTAYWENGLCAGVTYYSPNGYDFENVLFYENGDIYYIGMEYKQDDRNRYVTVSYNDMGYSDAITGEVTAGNRVEVFFYSQYNRVADYHWLFLDTNTYKPQISIYGETPVWSIGDLLESD